MGRPPGNGAPEFLDELQLLTTNHLFAAGQRPFVTMQDTSAAAALAGNLATALLARYPRSPLKPCAASWCTALVGLLP